MLDEARLPGARMGHEHRVEPAARGGARVTNRLYIEGPLARVYGALMGRRMRRGVQRFVVHERRLAEADAAHDDAPTGAERLA